MGGLTPFFVKLVLRQTRTRDQTFDEVTNPNRPLVPAVQPRPYLVNFRSILPNNHKGAGGGVPRSIFTFLFFLLEGEC